MHVKLKPNYCLKLNLKCIFKPKVCEPETVEIETDRGLGPGTGDGTFSTTAVAKEAPKDETLREMGREREELREGGRNF